MNEPQAQDVADAAPSSLTDLIGQRSVVEQVYPTGTAGLDQGEVLRAVFLHLKRKNSADNVRR